MTDDRKCFDLRTRKYGWCFTVNNYTVEDDLATKLLSMHKDVAYFICGKEVGEEGTPHHQGYVRFKQGFAKPGQRMKKFLPRANFRWAFGCDADQDYCWKEDQWLKVGTAQPRKDARTDLHKIRNAQQEGKAMNDMIEEGLVNNLQQLRLARELLQYSEPGRDHKPTVLWFHGPPGTGKSATAKRIAALTYGDKPWIKTPAMKGWFDGYDAHKFAILDDIRPRYVDFVLLLGLCDRYEYRVNVKHGSRQFVASYIIITAPYTVEDMFGNTEENMEQMNRRITLVKEFHTKLDGTRADKNEWIEKQAESIIKMIDDLDESE